MRRLVVAHTRSEIEALRAPWEWLHGQQNEATLFQGFQWNRLAAALFRHERPYVVYLETDSGVALIPAAVRNHSYLCLLGEELFDYRDVLWAGDFSVLARAWKILADTRLPLAETPVRGPSAQKHWSAFQLADFCQAPCVTVNITAEAFAASHRRSSRLFRRLARAGVRLGRYDGDNPALLKEIYTRRAALFNTRGENLFGDPCRVNFMLRVVAGAPSACHIFTLETASTLVAALVTFQDREVRRCYTTWFHPLWLRYSPGLALLFEATRLSLAEGLSCDYMTGEEDYKLRLATGAVPLYRAHGKMCRAFVGGTEREPPAAS